MAACTPSFFTGTPASPSPISTPASVPISMRSLKSPKWPMRNILPPSLVSPVPSDRSNASRITLRTLSAGEHRVEPLLLEQHLERLAQAVEQVGRRGVREVAVFAIGDHFVPCPVA